MKRKIAFFLGGKKYKLTVFGFLIIFLFTVLLTALLGELIVRSCIHLPLQKEYMRFSCLGGRVLPKSILDENLFWKPTDELNSKKFLNKKNDNMFRIICLGSSTTQGYIGKDMQIHREETYVYNLEKILKNKFNSINIEVINAGIGEYSSLQGLRYLKRDIWKYNPDLVISWFGFNDSMRSIFYQDKEQRIMSGDERVSKNILEHSKLYLFLKNYILINNAFKVNVPRVLPVDYYENCKKC